MRVLPMGAHAVIVEDPDPDPAAWSSAFRQLATPGVVDVVPAAATVLVRCASTAELHAAITRFDEVARVAVAAHDEADPVLLAVTYDGPDLDDVARATGLDVDQVIGLHADATYEVAFCGFAPGFAYLSGLPQALRLPRRATPRTWVPAGAVAIAHEYSAVYPTESPGGWHLIGRCEARLFDVDADPPALLRPGTRVRFEARRARR